MATFNPQISYLKEQVDSIRAQSYSHWFCLIADDHSTEENYQLLLKLIGGDKRFQVYRQERNRGLYRNFETLLEKVPSECSYVCFSDQDDVWRNDKLEKMVQEIKKSPYPLIHSDLKLIDEKGEEIHQSCWTKEKRKVRDLTLNQLIFRNVVTGCSAFFRADLVPKALPFPMQFISNAFLHDHWIALVALKHGGIGAVSEPLVNYRQHSNNVIGSRVRNKLSVKLLVTAREREVLIYKCLRSFLVRHELANSFYKEIPLYNPYHSSFDCGLRLLFYGIFELLRKGLLGQTFYQLFLGKVFFDLSFIFPRMQKVRREVV